MRRAPRAARANQCVSTNLQGCGGANGAHQRGPRCRLIDNLLFKRHLLQKALFTGWLQSLGLEPFDDVAGGAQIPFRTGLAAFVGIIGNRGDVGPPLHCRGGPGRRFGMTGADKCHCR